MFDFNSISDYDTYLKTYKVDCMQTKWNHHKNHHKF